MNPVLGTAAAVLVTVVTAVLGARGLRTARTASDFFVASRTVSPLGNAAAIGGEYLSAASFLGVAGLVMAFGPDMLWYPVGYTAGYLALLLLVAAPLRRSGAYTLPDFAEGRLGSLAARRAAAVFVLVIGWLYLVPQLEGAGLTLQTVTGAPPWAGAVLVAAVVTGNVAAGGMRAITLVQGVQFWLKLTAIALPAVFLLLAWHAAGSPTPAQRAPASFPRTTVVRIEARVAFDVHTSVRLSEVRGTLDGVRHDGGSVELTDGRHVADTGARLTFPGGSPTPVVSGTQPSTGRQWATPLSGAGGRGHPLYAVYSILLATFLGTMGLPHVLVRFYTNPDGRAARTTTLIVLGLLGAFYLVPTVYGVLGRIYAPELLLTGRTDAAVLVLPQLMVGGLGGKLLGALVAAGAFAAFLSTSSGLTVSVAGVLAQDLLEPLRRGTARSTRAFRWAAPAAMLPALGLAAALPGLQAADAIGLAFAVAASAFCPLLLLGIWWRGLTATGAVLGLLTGGTLAAGAVAATVLGIGGRHGWGAALLAQPAAWSVPLAFAVTVVGSLATRRSVRPDVDRVLLRMHAPEAVSGTVVSGAAGTGTAGAIGGGEAGPTVVEQAGPAESGAAGGVSSRRGSPGR